MKLICVSIWYPNFNKRLARIWFTANSNRGYRVRITDVEIDIAIRIEKLAYVKGIALRYVD